MFDLIETYKCIIHAENTHISANLASPSQLTWDSQGQDIPLNRTWKELAANRLIKAPILSSISSLLHHITATKFYFGYSNSCAVLLSTQTLLSPTQCNWLLRRPNQSGQHIWHKRYDLPPNFSQFRLCNEYQYSIEKNVPFYKALQSFYGVNTFHTVWKLIALRSVTPVS